MKHKDEIDTLIRDNKIDILAINETKLDNRVKDETVAISDYCLKRFDRNRHGGGVAVYIRETLNFEHRIDFPMGNLETICIEVKPNCSKPFFVLAWYRPPKYETETLTEMETLLRAVESEKKEIILIGDLNCDDLPVEDRNMMIKNLRDLYRVYQMKQLIKEPTRSTVTSATIIDHFATNKPSLIRNSAVFVTGFSDHDMIFGIRKVSSQINREPKIIKTHQLKHYDAQEFRDDLRKIDWEATLEHGDIDKTSCEWESKFLSVLDKHAPFRQRKVRNSHPAYIDKDLRHKMFLRDLHKKRFNASRNPDDWLRLKKLRNEVNSLKHIKKRTFYTQKVNETRGDIKGTWKALNSALGKKTKSATINSLKIKGKDLSNPMEIANELNNYFCDTARCIRSEDPALKSNENSPSFDAFIRKIPKTSKNFRFKPILPQDVMKAVQKQKNSNSGNIPTRFLKDAAPCVSTSLSIIFSKSLAQGKYTDNLKLARISAIYKGKGSKSNPDNYRPISVLSAVARLFEKLVHQQLFPHLKGLLLNNQSGFKPGHSTETSLLNTTNKWIINIDNGCLNLTLLLDLRKAFDTVDHKILLKKLDYYGIKDNDLSWFESYLSNRNQYCSIEGHESAPKINLAGIPQGSSLGPILFLVYINDLSCSLEHSETNLFADDTNFRIIVWLNQDCITAILFGVTVEPA